MVPFATSVRILPNRREWVYLAILLLVMLIFGARVDEAIFSRSEANVRVLYLRNIPPDCPSGLDLLSPRALIGSNRLLRRCGSIWTDHGRFRLIPTGSSLPFAMSRRDMMAMLRPNRCYEVRWFGYEPDPIPGAPFDTSERRGDNTIYSVAARDDGECGPLPPSLALPRRVFWEEVRAGLVLHLRVEFIGPSDAVLGLAEHRDVPVLRVRIAQPEGGEVGNAALLAFLAREMDLPPGEITVASGHSASRKSILIRGNPADLVPRLAKLVLL